MSTPHLAYWLAALKLPDIGPRRFMHWLSFFDNIKLLFEAEDARLMAIGLTAKERRAIQQPDWAFVEKEQRWLHAPHRAIITLADEAYPSALKAIADPPLVLYVAGNVAILSHPQIAIVGSRHPTASGLSQAKIMSSALAQAGWVVTSGLALGIDAASHQGACAANGLTIGVCGTGLNHVYPASHHALFEMIIERQGAIISEFSLNTPPRAAHFPRRNRIISGLSLGVLVVEAALKSGSLITARHAIEQGREVFAIPGSVHHPLARGCHHLIRQGAKLVETVTDIVEEFPFVPVASAHIKKNAMKQIVVEKPMKLGAKECGLIEHIGYEMTSLDMILCRSGLTASELSSMLLTLELEGYIRKTVGGYIRID